MYSHLSTNLNSPGTDSPVLLYSASEAYQIQKNFSPSMSRKKRCSHSYQKTVATFKLKKRTRKFKHL